MQIESAEGAEGELRPTFCLIYRGLSEDADRPKLTELFARLLRLPAEEAQQALATPPVQLTCDADRSRVRQHQMGLARIGCIASIDAAWQHQRWTLPDSLLQSFTTKDTAPRVLALLQVHPAPGHGRLHRLSQLLGEIRCHALNHADLLLICPPAQGQGAGAWLRQIRKKVLPALRAWQSDARLESSLGLYPDDGTRLPALLDVLNTRLEQAEAPSDSRLLQGPDWPFAGRHWQLAVRLPPDAPGRAGIDARLQDWLKSQWPIGPASDDSTPPQADQWPVWLREFAQDKPQRARRCQQLQQSFAGLDRLPSLPAVAVKAYRLAQNPDSDNRELSRTVEQDPSLSTRLLTIVNSAYFGLRARVDSIAHALVILGREEVTHLALLVSGETVFRGLKSEAGQRLWHHSALCAEITRLLAMRNELTNQPALYTAALLHDVGKIFLLSFAPKPSAEIETLARRHQLPAYELEREMFGHDHATLGAAMLRSWDLPDNICTLVEQHHGPLPGQSALSPEAALIGLADHLAHRMEGDDTAADACRLRRQQLRCLPGRLAGQTYETLDLLAEDVRGEIRDPSAL